MIDLNLFKNLYSTPYGIIIIICCLIALIPTFGFFSSGYIFEHFAKDNLAINAGEKWRLLTSVFLHADIGHLFFNMYSLFILGGAFIQLYGYVDKNPNISFVIVFIVAGICGSLASYYFNPTNSLGASGAIFGLIGSLISFSVLKGQPQMLSQFSLIIVMNLAFGFIPNSNLDNSAHIGGALGGAVIGAILLLI